MGKQEIKQTTTNVPGLGTHLEQSIAYDENYLPSAQELAAYKDVDPLIIPHILESAQKEQKNRHEISRAKIELIENENKRNHRLNWWGMLFAAFCVIGGFGLTAVALYLNRPWFAAGTLFGSLLSIVGIFVKDSKTKK